MASLRKPKLKKYPRKPKASSSSDVMERWLDKVKDIDKSNKKAQADYLKEKKTRETLRTKISKVKSPADAVKTR